MRFLDPDNTYDILFAQKIKPAILTLLTNALGSHSIFDYEFPICLIDRLIPNPISPWCDNWSGLFFEFLKKLSRTHILDDGFLNGSAYGFDPPYQANLPQTIDLSAYKVESLTLIIPANSEGIITWQERDHEPQSAHYCANLTNKLAITRRRGRVLVNRESIPKEITLSCHNWLHNSVCIAGVEFSGLTDNQSTFLLYENMAAFLDYLWGELGIPECQIIKQFDVIKINEYFAEGENDPVNDDVQNPTLGGYFTQPPRSLPAEIYNFGLPDNRLPYSQYALYAWKAASIVYFYGDEWHKFYDLENFINWNFWGNPIYTPLPPERLPGDFDSNKRIARANPVFSTLPDWFYFAGLMLADGTLLGHEFTWRYSEETETFEAQFFDWQPEPLPESPPAGASQAQIDAYNSAVAIRRKKYTLSPNVNPELFPDFSTLQTVYRVACSHPSDMDQWVHGQLQLLGGSEYWARRGKAAITTRDSDRTATGRLLNFVSSAYANDRLMRGFEESNDFAIYANFPPYLIESSEAYLGIFRFEFAFDFLSGGGNKFCWFWGSQKIIATPVFQPDGTYFYQYVPQGDFEYSGVGLPPLNGGIQIGDTINFSKSFTVKVNFRSQPPTPYQPFTEAELTAISEAFDPNPDQGDIMPDSTRIKEIHAALEADRFANHSESTPENPKATLRTLGRLIEASGRVLGINIDENGANIPYPDPMFLDPEKLEEINQKAILTNSQFAVADMGGALDTSGLYEVRSAIAKSTGKGKEEIDLRPHAVKYHNIPQLIDIMAEDTSKQLGGGQNSIYQVPNADKNGFQQYSGVFQGLADALYMLSVHGKAINELQNQSIKTNFLLIQILKGLGLPCTSTKVEGISGVFDKDGNPVQGWMPVPMVDPFGPTLTSLFGVVLMNLQRMVGSTLGYKTDESSNDDKISVVSVSASTFVVNPGATITFKITRTKPEERITVGYNLTGSIPSSDLADGDLGRASVVMEKGESESSISIKIKDLKLTENEFLRLILEGGEGYQISKNPIATVAILPKEEPAPPEEKPLEDEEWQLQPDEVENKPDFSGLNQIIQELKNQLEDQ